MQSFHNLAAQSATLIKRLDELLAEMNVAIIKRIRKKAFLIVCLKVLKS